MSYTGNSFVVVSVQYRLGPFGYLASDEVVKKGVANAGLLDQFFALQWVQTYIGQFGGDPSAVTISGESAGAGAVLLQDIAYDEGPLFTPQNITSKALLLDRLRGILPDFSAENLANVLLHYPVLDDTKGVKFATTGVSGPSALDQSGLATGQQQRANNIYAELTFVCPSYWMAEAFSGGGRTSYKY
ncbi:acetylcholinesterase precursor [Stemphylium lycopersici]|uniref:Carboxylic ester hydrolase n=1 Tax=Stemphylium lycopersici TaxID=183478 RepID=A0A364MWU9_STELY|nr:carboxylesterase type b [Stemphylium lycopersici]RAQ98692.1 acetylcholinesterase precursor [Stemphylium lycopersici]RAR05873.1 acetylcholinesterase precursor [Stemphylium lycopersici]